MFKKEYLPEKETNNIEDVRKCPSLISRMDNFRFFTVASFNSFVFISSVGAKVLEQSMETPFFHKYFLQKFTALSATDCFRLRAFTVAKIFYGPIKKVIVKKFYGSIKKIKFGFPKKNYFMVP